MARQINWQKLIKLKVNYWTAILVSKSDKTKWKVIKMKKQKHKKEYKFHFIFYPSSELMTQSLKRKLNRQIKWMLRTNASHQHNPALNEKERRENKKTLVTFSLLHWINNRSIIDSRQQFFGCVQHAHTHTFADKRKNKPIYGYSQHLRSET